MKANEELYLKDLVKKFNKCLAEYKSVKEFYSDGIDIMDASLQELSFKGDISFFDEVAFILSVITSIITHPHLLNKGEEVIIRSELAPGLSSEMFIKTIKDSRLWREDDMSMIPENVYYYQQIDEIRIYENIFIVNLINKLAHEIDKYKDFYINAIGFVKDSRLSMKKDNVDIAFKKILSIERKLKHIKNTYFYKVINKDGSKLSRVTPTNILIKDRLYNYCYKFYKKLITYKDRYLVVSDIRVFYFMKLLRLLRLKGFKLIEDAEIEIENNKLLIPSLGFSNDDFIINLDADDDNLGLLLTITNKNIKNKLINTSKNLLIFDDHSVYSEISIKNKDEYTSIYLLTLWSLIDIDSEFSPVFDSIRGEDELIEEYLNSRLLVMEGSSDIYTSYCPACRSSQVESNNDGIYTCEACKSKYAFYRNKENINDSIWFIKLRR